MDRSPVDCWPNDCGFNMRMIGSSECLRRRWQCVLNLRKTSFWEPVPSFELPHSTPSRSREMLWMAYKKDTSIASRVCIHGANADKARLWWQVKMRRGSEREERDSGGASGGAWLRCVWLEAPPAGGAPAGLEHLFRSVLRSLEKCRLGHINTGNKGFWKSWSSSDTP